MQHRVSLDIPSRLLEPRMAYCTATEPHGEAGMRLRRRRQVYGIPKSLNLPFL
jgi:hypothetical protein